jgi:hypothetical protein
MIFIVIFISYIAFIIFLIVGNYKTNNIVWFCFMLIGFCLAFFGLAFYISYIYSINCSENKLFYGISGYIWKLNYYLDLDIFEQYRLMNIGIALYIYGAVCFSLSYLKNQRIKKWGYIVMTVIAALIITVIDPEILKAFYRLNDNAVIQNKVIDQIRDINHVFYWLIKICLIGSIAILAYTYNIIVPILKKKFKYMIIGIIPIHILFVVLFYKFPNYSIIFRRYNQLNTLSIPYNKFLYGLITYLSILSIGLLAFAIFKYNIFEINIRKHKVSFQQQFDTAHVGLKVFSHSIKNQFIAIKLLTEQLAICQDKTKKQEIIDEVVNISNSSIKKLSTSTELLGIFKLNYSYIDISEFAKGITNKFKNLNPNTEFLFESKCNVFLFIDVKLLEKVLENVLINALEACREVDKDKIKVIIDKQHGYGIISISDNGKGIDKKDFKKVFKPFYSTKRTLHNWGIGLAFCHKVIEAFGGAIEIDSKVSMGTTVQIYIPLIKR